MIEIRFAPSGDPLGYKVARPSDRTAAGFPVYYSGSKLAADLSLPKLLRRWDARTGTASQEGAHAAHVLAEARYRVDSARRAIVADRAGRGRENVEGIVHATADVLTAVRGFIRERAQAGRVGVLTGVPVRRLDPFHHPAWLRHAATRRGPDRGRRCLAWVGFCADASSHQVRDPLWGQAYVGLGV